ncbi:LCP family protein [Dictyobacter arantiisoli]|uniref:Cell envelope-related transcriptional attenuator domain-containing protein n=1 Tax=Dictyobacter arantiisoli TaxID=2014874 RepID=A0A5A5TAU6_9CHLR|nr:LCP family protein [Dictyobacter arantiisoli]GCF08286.1 hypothetical protein KDI_18500 [Dictyobacter arantiisoli]
MKNQFMNKPSPDGDTGQAGNQAQSQNNPGKMTPPSQDGLLKHWKTGQLQHPEQQVGDLIGEPITDPLERRKMPRPPYQTGTPRQPVNPAANPFAMRPSNTHPPIVSQSGMPNAPAPSEPGKYQPPSQQQAQTYPGGQPRAPQNNQGFPGLIPPSSQPPLNQPSTHGDVHQYPNSGRDNYNGQAGPVNGYSFPLGPGQPGNPNLTGNPGFSGPPPEFQPAPAVAAKKRRIPIWARIAIGVLVFFLVVGGSAYAYYQFTFSKSVSDITGQGALHMVNGTTQAVQETNVDPLTTRTNILLLGSDTDGKGNDPTTGTPLAQTVIIITIDPQTKYVGMLSIPRDMQVSDAQYGTAKIDEAFEHAWRGKNSKESAQLAAGHMEEVIKENYGITIDHYAWVGLQGFIKVIDSIGGIDIDVQHPIFDDVYPDDTGNGNKYGYTRLNIAPGPQHLDGHAALTYVRTRHADLGGDFGRTDRQQQVLGQIKLKLTNTDAITQAPQILNALDGYLMTDLQVSQLATFAQVAKDVDINKIDRVSFTNDYSYSLGANTTNVAPYCNKIVPKIQKMFGVQGNCNPQSSIQPAGTGIAMAPPSTIPTQTAAVASTTSSASIGSTGVASPSIQTASMSQSAGNTTAYNNLVNLMLLAVSGSFNAMQ